MVHGLQESSSRVSGSLLCGKAFVLGPFVQNCLAQDDDDEEAKNQKHTVMVFNEDVGADGSAGLRVFLRRFPRLGLARDAETGI